MEKKPFNTKEQSDLMKSAGENLIKNIQENVLPYLNSESQPETIEPERKWEDDIWKPEMVSEMTDGEVAFLLNKYHVLPFKEYTGESKPTPCPEKQEERHWISEKDFEEPPSNPPVRSAEDILSQFDFNPVWSGYKQVILCMKEYASQFKSKQTEEEIKNIIIKYLQWWGSGLCPGGKYEDIAERFASQFKAQSIPVGEGEIMQVTNPNDPHFNISQKTLSIHLKASESREEKYKTALQNIKDFIKKVGI